jgi:hypothetical protein
MALQMRCRLRLGEALVSVKFGVQRMSGGMMTVLVP